MEYKIVDWTPNHVWLVAVTGPDGSYTPVLELHKTGDGAEPNYQNQLYCAAAILAAGGIKDLDNPHGATGRMCKCGDCFCCAAAEIVRRAREIERGRP